MRLAALLGVLCLGACSTQPPQRLAQTSAVTPVVGGNSQREIQARSVESKSYDLVKESLLDAIAEAGLIAQAESHVATMLKNTAESFGKSNLIYEQAEIIPFCSSTIAWKLFEEDAEQIAMCPLTIALYTLTGNPHTVHVVWRQYNGDSPAHQAANALLQSLVSKTIERSVSTRLY